MRVLGVDIETSGLDLENDHIVELAYVVKDIGSPRVISTYTHYVYDESYGPEPLLPELTEIHGIDNEMVRTHGIPLESALKSLEEAVEKYQVQYIIAYNGSSFDKPFILKKAEQRGVRMTRTINTHWVDPIVDIEFPRKIRSRALPAVCAELGFLNPFPHVALTDVLSMLKMFECFDVDRTIERSRSPFMVCRAIVSFEEREKAKSMRYLWQQAGDKNYPKCWVKKIKGCDLNTETEAAKAAGFQLSVLEEWY